MGAGQGVAECHPSHLPNRPPPLVRHSSVDISRRLWARAADKNSLHLRPSDFMVIAAVQGLLSINFVTHPRKYAPKIYGLWT